MDEKILKKLYIEETLKSRKYFGYRVDIALIKMIITLISFIAIYFYTNAIAFSIIAGVQIFLLITLINKLFIDRKIKAGKEKLFNRLKMNKFRNRLYYSSYDELESFIMLYLNQYRYKNVIKIKNYCYNAIKNEEKAYIFIARFYEDSYVEKIDIRNVLSEYFDNKVNKALIISVNDFDEDAQKYIESINNKVNIEVIKFKDLYEFANNNLLLCDEFEYSDIEGINKKIHNKASDIIGNIFTYKKTVLYALAALLFYFLYDRILQNSIAIYIAYYFVFLLIINIIYNILIKITRKVIVNKDSK